MNSVEQEYFQRRERAERTAAKIATCTEARRVHQELAQRYAALAQQYGVPAPSDPPPKRRKLAIVTPSPPANAVLTG